MLVDDHPQRAAMVEQALKVCGFHVVAMLASASGLLFQIQELKPHVVMIDIESPDRDVLESLSLINQHNPTPVVMFSNEEDPAFIRQAINVGVSAYMMEDINPDKVKPVIDVALAQFEMFQTLRRQLSSTQQELDDKNILDKAKRLLMKHQKIAEPEAHKNMRNLAMNNNQTLVDVAKNVIAILDQDSKKAPVDEPK
jgi:response regulator NasT